MNRRCVVCGGSMKGSPFPNTCSRECAGVMNRCVGGYSLDLLFRPPRGNFDWLADFACSILRRAIAETAAPLPWRPVAVADVVGVVRNECPPLAPQGGEELTWRGRHQNSLELAWGDVPHKEWPCRFTK